jgi:hypothetical protein
MKTNYVFIDFENVQRHDITFLRDHPCKIFVFVGSNQSRIPFELVSAIQKLGEQAEYIKIDGTGHNALDFHVAFYVGRMAERDPEGSFFIISKDTGFDPLIRYLKNSGITAQRLADVAAITIAKPAVPPPVSTSKRSGSAPAPVDEKIKLIMKNLRHRGQSKPRNLKTLHNVVHVLFLKKLDEKQLEELIEQLKKLGIITVNAQGKVSYKLPEGD